MFLVGHIECYYQGYQYWIARITSCASKKFAQDVILIFNVIYDRGLRSLGLPVGGTNRLEVSDALAFGLLAPPSDLPL